MTNRNVIQFWLFALMLYCFSMAVRVAVHPLQFDRTYEFYPALKPPATAPTTEPTK